jgi:tRNA1Val (adenine37-N6)-methyltransferase
MGNQWFQFKQFKIYQDKTAMKVGTDGTLLGAWTTIPKSGKALDIGTGTGLIALMIAQRNPKLKIIAIDVEQNAVEQALENISLSKFSSNVSVLQQSFIEFGKQTDMVFDLIVCNPPFYKTSNPGKNEKRALARHADSLRLVDLISLSSKMLSQNGVISLILPSEQLDDLQLVVDDVQMNIQKIVHVKPTPNKKPHRILVQVGREKVELDESILIIEEFGRHLYSDEFKKLVSPFYLNQ